MRIAVLSHAPPGTGTYTSSHRIARHLEAAGHDVDVVEHWDPDVEAVLNEYEFASADLLVGTHAVQSGRVFTGLGVPFVLVISGTDLNEYYDSTIARAAVSEARLIVTYDRQHLERARAVWPECSEKLRHIRKGVATNPSLFDLRNLLGLDVDTELFLLPSGLRPVKDVLFVADVFEAWEDEGIDRHLAIVGLPRDPSYVEHVHRFCDRSRVVTLAPPLRQPDLHAAIRQSDVVLNTSRSESSPNALLEAMHLGACIIARDIPGNRALIDHGYTGLLFRSPEQFRQLTETRMNDGLSAQLGSAAAEHARIAHGLDQERECYQQLIDECS